MPRIAFLVAVMSLAFCSISQAELVSFTSQAGTLGNALDGSSSGTFAVPDFTGLTFTIVSVNSTDTTPGTPVANSNSTSFGVDSPIAGTGDDSDGFDASFNESITFSFSGLPMGQRLQVSQIDFITFTSGESFNFAGQSIVHR